MISTEDTVCKSDNIPHIIMERFIELMKATNVYTNFINYAAHIRQKNGERVNCKLHLSY